jgi:hypothetical protein
MRSCYLTKLALLPKRLDIEDPNSEQGQTVALAAYIRGNSLVGSVCADARTRRAGHPYAHRHADIHLTAALADSHGNAYTAAAPLSRHAYAFRARLV